MTASKIGSDLLTVDDLTTIELPDRWELIEGELVELSPTTARSSRISGRLYRLVTEYGEDTGLGWVYNSEAGFVLTENRRTLRSPDVSFVRGDRLEDPDPEAYISLAPDFAIEVLSPSDRYSSALRKALLYIEAGTELVWVVHPGKRSVTILAPETPPVTLTGNAELTAEPVLPGLRISLNALFRTGR